MFRSETEKIRPIVEKYFSGRILDIGCNIDKVTPGAFAIDSRKTEAVDWVIPDLSRKISEQMSEAGIDNVFDVVFSSHCLEHIADAMGSLADWISMTKTGGYIVLYLPDVRYYTEYNPEHLQEYTYDSFMPLLKNFSDIEVVESGMDVGDQRYSFYVVMKKL